MGKPLKGKSAPTQGPKPPQPEPMCVFAFRLPLDLREAIHAAAGRGKATQFALAALRAAVQRAQKTTK